ncbi:MFS transporter [Haloglycomyces albus]|uniref:MFS transporter n=1 Tax=Haloglycomyces albus TaxID=526067 RepID=UPI00046D8EF5|nr:MFS transporter [Haloglycomyces albus]
MTTQTTDTTAIQKRSLASLSALQTMGGLSVSTTIAIGAIMMEDLTGSSALAGIAQSLFVAGAALIVIPTVAATERWGRRGGLAFAYLTATVGALLIILALHTTNVGTAVIGFFLVGAASCANHQGRFAGADLAPPHKRGTHLSIVVWTVTIGSVFGPSLAALTNSWWSDNLGGPQYLGPVVITGSVAASAATLSLLLLRPDPLLHARSLAPTPTDTTKKSIAHGLHLARQNPIIRSAVLMAVVAHFTMVGVMTMTSIHIKHGTDNLETALSIIGIVIGMHIGGMYALAPVFGHLTDRWGSRTVGLIGLTLLILACGVSGTAPASAHLQLTLGLALLGFGWSALTVASATRLTGAVGPDDRPSTQGFSDLTMGLAAVISGLASGPIVEKWGFATLCGAMALIAVLSAPLLARRR